MPHTFSLQKFFDSRTETRREFVDAHGYNGVVIAPLYEDMASRRFYRLKKNGRSAVLMDSLPDDHPHATRGHRLHDYIRLAVALREQDIHAPDIYAANEKAGFLLMEDLGDDAMDDAHLDKAVDVLIRLREGFIDNVLELPDYFASHIHEGHRRVVDWYMPSERGAPNPDTALMEYRAAWQEIEKQLPPPLTGFLHVDYARHNLRLMNGVCGVLDFQGAHWGPLAYDLVNLLDDARTLTPDPLKTAMKDRYKDGLGAGERDAFDLWYAVLVTQFHCRVAGQFIKLALAGGKPRYLDYIPLVQAYLREDLRHPLLRPLARWFADYQVDFSTPVRPAMPHIAPDAF